MRQRDSQTSQTEETGNIPRGTFSSSGALLSTSGSGHRQWSVVQARKQGSLFLEDNHEPSERNAWSKSWAVIFFFGSSSICFSSCSKLSTSSYSTESRRARMRRGRQQEWEGLIKKTILHEVRQFGSQFLLRSRCHHRFARPPPRPFFRTAPLFSSALLLLTSSSCPSSRILLGSRKRAASLSLQTAAVLLLEVVLSFGQVLLRRPTWCPQNVGQDHKVVYFCPLPQSQPEPRRIWSNGSSVFEFANIFRF